MYSVYRLSCVVDYDLMSIIPVSDRANQCNFVPILDSATISELSSFIFPHMDSLFP